MKTTTWTISQKSLQTSDLEIAYLEAGPEDGRPIIFFHGFPDCARSYSDIMIDLANHGYKTFAPFTRGFFPTIFLNKNTERLGDMASLGQDAINFFDALDLNNAIIVGQDWGSATAEILTLSRQNKISKLIKLNWHGIYSMTELAKSHKFNYEQMQKTWYIWLLNTSLGEPAIRFDTDNFCGALWKQWSPSWNSEELLKCFNDAKPAFHSPDFSAIVLSAYRSGMTSMSEASDQNKLQSLIKNPPAITCDTIVLTGSNDTVEMDFLSDETMSRYFTGNFNHYLVKDSGHFIHRENPYEVISAILK